ncbi:MAG TPA: glycosyltransferase family 4 protein [Kofleriaceae bacterium]|jgi:glycosyltransferase involved in cell wall biosynthesis
MRVGVVTTSYPRFAGDPAGSFVGAHVAAMRAMGLDVDVIAAADRSADRAADRAADATSGDARVWRVPARDGLFYRGGAPDAIERSPARSLAAAAAFTARFTRELRARSGAWDAIVAHWWAPSALAAIAARPLSRVPLVAIAHGGDVYTLARLGLLAPALHLLRARRARLVFVSAALRAVARAAAPALDRWLDDALVQPMGIDVAHFAGIARAPEAPPIVLVAARCVPIKGIDVAIEAMRGVPHARLVVAGDGPERAQLATRGVGELLGEVTAQRRDELLARASLVAIPSRVVGTRTEGMPLIALEALAARVPVVASRVGGLAELGDAVALVPPDDPAALARAIERVLANPPPPEQLAAAVAHLDWRAIAPRLLRAA